MQAGLHTKMDQRRHTPPHPTLQIGGTMILKSLHHRYYIFARFPPFSQSFEFAIHKFLLESLICIGKDDPDFMWLLHMPLQRVPFTMVGSASGGLKNVRRPGQRQSNSIDYDGAIQNGGQASNLRSSLSRDKGILETTIGASSMHIIHSHIDTDTDTRNPSYNSYLRTITLWLIS